MTPHLRPPTAADHVRVADILIQSRAAFMPYAPSAHSEAEVREWVRETLIPAGGVTVATVQGGVVGVLVVAHEGEQRWIQQMMVHPSFVGRGIGTRLLEHALQVLPPPIRLYAFQANTGARRFYERHGFEAIALSEGEANEERCPDVLYERRFAGPTPQPLSALPVDVVQRQLEAYNAKHLDAWLATYAAGAQQFALHGELLAAGHEQMRVRMQARFEEPDLHARLLHRTVMGAVVVDHEVVTRNFPEGAGTMEMLCVYEVADGLIQKASFAFGEKKLAP
ncbi:MAG TPA: GNAT family N-acetyltransferase [Ideonella sp.]|nr:GNAT family N-acetyltransferase [Ideonella sp.]